MTKNRRVTAEAVLKDRCRRTRSRQHGAREPRPQRGPASSEVVLALAVLGLPCARESRLSLLFAQLVCWCVMCVVDMPRRRVSTGPALTCLTRRRCRTALFALRATTTSGPLFRCAVVLQNEDSQPLITPSYTTAAASAVGVALVISKGRLLPFVTRCSVRCLASFLSRGLVLCLRRAREAQVLCAAVCLLLLHSALDVVARRAALKYAAPCCSRRWAASVPASRSRTGLSGGVAVMGRSGGSGGGPPGLALGERPWPLMKGECAGPFGVLAPSLDVAQRCLFRLINFIDSFT